MPHLRKRYAESRIIHATKYSPVVGVLGQRQVGKSTLMEKTCREYITFDDERNLLIAEQMPLHFLEDRKQPFAIDEAQLCPKIFSAIKERVRINRAPGQIMLSGSVRFSSRKLIRESLTGRITLINLLPFTRSESHQEPMTNHLETILFNNNMKTIHRAFAKIPSKRERQFLNYLETGGLPGICFFRENSIRLDKWSAQLDTLLNRDVRLVYNTTLPYSSLRRFLEYIAQRQGRALELKEASQYSRISTITLKKVLYAFEAMFLIKEIDVIGGEKKAVYFLEDQGMASWLKGKTVTSDEDIIRGIYANLRQEIVYKPEVNGKIFQYRTRNDAVVPLVFEYKGRMLGIVATTDDVPAPKTLGSVYSFLKKYSNAKCVVAYGGKIPILKSERELWLPYWTLS